MYQKIIIVGRLGRDPEMRFTPSGQALTSFSVATDRKYKGSDGQDVKETTWFRVTAWGKLAETANNFLKKGSMVLIEGRLTADPKTGGPRMWTGQDGTSRASFEVTASEMKFLSSRSDTAGGSHPVEDVDVAAGEDNIPF